MPLLVVLQFPAIGQAQESPLPQPADQAWVLCAAAFVFLMQCGFLCLEVGSVQPRAATITALKNVVDWVVAVVFFFFVGWGVMFGHSLAGLTGRDFLMLEGAVAGGRTELGLHLHFLFQLL